MKPIAEFNSCSVWGFVKASPNPSSSPGHCPALGCRENGHSIPRELDVHLLQGHRVSRGVQGHLWTAMPQGRPLECVLSSGQAPAKPVEGVVGGLRGIPADMHHVLSVCPGFVLLTGTLETALALRGLVAKTVPVRIAWM